MNIQIYGSKKCFDTQKAERYFKERRVNYQYVDLFKYGLSKGEFNSVMTSVGLENLINPHAKEYKALNLHRISVGNSSREDILIQNPKLFNTPIVRNGKKATIGFKPEIWTAWE